TLEPAPQNSQLMPKHRVLSLKPHLRFDWRGQDGQNETQKPDHSVSLGDSITSSTRMRFRYTQAYADGPKPAIASNEPGKIGGLALKRLSEEATPAERQLSGCARVS